MFTDSVKTAAPLPHAFVAGREEGLRLLRRVLQGTFLVSHLPIEGEACLARLERNPGGGGVLWLSPWAVGHAAFVAARLGHVCFVLVHPPGSEPLAALPGCRCLHVNEASLIANPAREARRLVAFLRGLGAEAASPG
ncbi:MAG: hypothetical protein JNJ54_27030 [Myxococcaceae bacterium]|nr:hypothetical protein [Myxococcaceae bacterium]